MLDSNERIAILGASRGLGFALANRFLAVSQSSLWLVARKASALSTEPQLQAHLHRIQPQDLDFTKDNSIDNCLAQMAPFKPTRLIYCAGGGPFGPFQDKPWHSHLWSLKLNLLFPAQLLHSLLGGKTPASENLRQIIFVGSAIAESRPDPLAASYASGKHGLKGLLSSLRAESNANTMDIRLYSPGYMDTPLLPPHSLPRQGDSWIADPQKIADDLIAWALTPSNMSDWHRVLISKDQLN